VRMHAYSYPPFRGGATRALVQALIGQCKQANGGACTPKAPLRHPSPYDTLCPTRAEAGRTYLYRIDVLPA
jgi:hypothetical protein